MATVSSESFADSSNAGIVERHVQCAQTSMHLTESAAPTGSSRLQSSVNSGNRINKQFQLFFGVNIITRITLQRHNCCDKLVLFLLKQESVRPRWPYDMRPSVRAEKYMCVIVIR